MKLLSRLVSATLVAASIAGCEGPSDIDDYGGPSGYTRISGTVLGAGGEAVDPGTQVALTRCESPVGGLAGKTTTDSNGSYSLTGSLPPVGMPEGRNSIELECEVIVGLNVLASGPLDVTFHRTTSPDTLTPLVVDLREP
ncbi:carboxypeptidase-like regulatory domain-containing protein [Gaopeijia maritima]|uniref:Carboxypeptidase-like regulatory domain-containing protein n=1 Tax=Gaopeijia maritima TaxID=3119007 RepID=A0ABU9EB88_9BACT